jgi:xylulokinase
MRGTRTRRANEGPAFDDALLASSGTGDFASMPEACDATIQRVETSRVDPAAKAFYDRAYAVYQQLYRDLSGSFRTISALVSAGT